MIDKKEEKLKETKKTEENKNFDPLKVVTIEESMPDSQIVVSGRQLRTGIIRDYHLAPVEITSGTTTPDNLWTIKLNGKLYYIPIKEI